MVPVWSMFYWRFETERTVIGWFSQFWYFLTSSVSWWNPFFFIFLTLQFFCLVFCQTVLRDILNNPTPIIFSRVVSTSERWYMKSEPVWAPSGLQRTLTGTDSDGILQVSIEWAGQPHSARVSNTLKQPVHCCRSPLRQQQTIMTCAVSNDVEEQNFITLAAALTANRYPSRSVWAFFLSRNCHSLAEVSGLHFLLLAANFPPWSHDPLIPHSWASLSPLPCPSLSLSLFLLLPLSFCFSHRHRRMYLLWYLCQWPLPEYPRAV